MSAAPLPLGNRPPIEVALNGRTLRVHRVTGATLPALQAWQADVNNPSLAWALVRVLAPTMTDAEADALEIDDVAKIIWLANADLNEVYAALAKGEGTATTPPA